MFGAEAEVSLLLNFRSPQSLLYCISMEIKPEAEAEYSTVQYPVLVLYCTVPGTVLSCTVQQQYSTVLYSTVYTNTE